MKIKKIFAGLIAVMCMINIYSCSSTKKLEKSKEIKTAVKIVTTNIKETSYDNNIDFEKEAKEIIKSNNYTDFDLGYLSLELPWIDRRCPSEIADDSEHIQTLYCNQGSFDSSVSPNLNSIFISIEKVSIKSLSRYDTWFNEYAKESDYKIYDSETLNDNNISKALYYKFRSYKTNRDSNSSTYYTTYRYVFYDREKNVIEMTIRIPEAWNSDCEEIATHIYKSVQLPEGHYPDNDFLSIGDNYKTFQEYRNQGRYYELCELLKQHLSTDDIKKNDSAYKAIEIIDKIMPYINSVDIEYNEIDNKGVIKYKSVKNISPEIHIVPIVYTNCSDISLKLGFEKIDWLFFDKVTVTGKEKNWSRTIKSYDKIQEVVSGSKIRESIIENISLKDMLDISQNDEPVVQFKNQKEDKNVEFQLSQDEINAIKVAYEFNVAYKDLSDLLFDYKKYMC